MVIISRTDFGGMDLNIIGNLTGATILNQEDISNSTDYSTKLTIKDVNGFIHTIVINQEK